MGTLGGHLLPGGFFIVFAVWWSFGTAMRYIQARDRNNGKKNGLSKKYTASPTMPCICCPFRIQKLPIESFVKIFFTTVGIAGEIITGIKIHDKPSINLPTPSMSMSMPMSGEHQHQHEHKREVNIEVSTWHFEAVNSQHITMYTGFLIGAIVEVMIHYKVNLPHKIDFVCGIFAFAIEAILFQFHLHGRDQLDIQLHTLLVLAIYGCVFSCILEYMNPHNVLYTYSRILFTFLQGTWFCQAGFILYPPWKFLENRWNAENHQHIMFITTSFMWHFFFILITLFIQYLILNRFYGTKYTTLDDEESFEDEQQLENLISNKKTNGKLLDLKTMNETSFNNNNNNNGLQNVSLSDDDSEIEFDNSKIIQNSSNKTNNSSSSSTSDRKR